MKINFTKKEYRLLLDIIYMGQWVMEAHKTSDVDGDDGYEMLMQKIYSHAKEMGCEELVTPSKEENRFYTTQLFQEESGVHDHIDNYNKDTFWDELINELAERDARTEAIVSGKKISSATDLWELSGPYEARYADEFSENGLKHLFLRKDEH